MKYIVFCAVFAALVAVSVADNLLAESASKEQRSLLSQRDMLERARVAKKRPREEEGKRDWEERRKRNKGELMFGGGVVSKITKGLRKKWRDWRRSMRRSMVIQFGAAVSRNAPD